MARDRSLDIAVTGMAGRFPGSSNVDELWSAVKGGEVRIIRYKRDELLEAGVPETIVDDPHYVPARGHMSGALRFDNTLFRVSPRDAEMMDPQHRLMLETAWAALEDEGSGLGDQTTTTGVYASGSGSGYLRSMVASGTLDAPMLDQALHGTEPDFIASLIAYKVGLTGPAVAVQTACSSSLVGVHLAVQALLSGDCDRAVVVAAGIAFPQAGHLHLPGSIHSASGECRPFDERADGVVAGSGVACVVLRRLADALDIGSEPYGVILGTAINNDGAAKAGYFAPSVGGQEAVIRAALRSADVDGPSIGYLEAHGTATPVGDPIEWSAASAAFKAARAGPGQVAVGALKANVGHLDAAAGVASLIKALVVLKDGVIPPLAGFTRLNPLLETDDSPLFVPSEAGPWIGPLPRRAGVSAFGIGGTNAHVIIEQAPVRPANTASPKRVRRLVLLSTADPESLARSEARLRDHVDAAAPDLADVSFTLAAGRPALPHRLAVIGRTSREISDRLATGLGVARGCSPKGGPAHVVFLFPGQGAQHPGMACSFIASLPGFAVALEACIDSFGPTLASRVRGAVLDVAFPAAELDRTDLAQPALFAVEYATAVVLSALGLRPDAVVGHSLGEITAACIAGILDLSDAARFVAARGRAMHSCPPGAMLALARDEKRTCELVAESGLALTLAAVNGPELCVVAGSPSDIEDFQSLFGDHFFTKVLRTSRAFHSPLIEAAVPEMASSLAGVELHNATVPLAMNTTGQIVGPGTTRTRPDYFLEQARRPVRFADALTAVAARFPGAVAVEVGPGRTLSALAEGMNLSAFPLAGGRDPDTAEALSTLGRLWTLGQPVAVTALCSDGRPIHLPSYPFGGPSWIAAEALPRLRATGPAHDTTAGPDARSPEPTWEPTQNAGNENLAQEWSKPDAEVLLTRLWAELLGHGDLTADSDFFELGGDSLLITQLARRLNREVGVRVPLRAMLAAKTLGGQSQVVLDELAQPTGDPTGPG
ncbi:MAG: type I polyketide synthase [Acidimicrobiales bacterium]